MSLPFTDRALRPGEDDLLNRDLFVSNLVEVICNSPKNESNVFSIYGKWGEGKTSTLALFEHSLQTRIEEELPVPLVIKFNPWVFSGRENLFQAFFLDIGNAMGNSDDESQKERAKKWKRMGTYASMLGGGLDHVDTVLNTFGASIPGWKLLGKFLGSVEGIAEQAEELEEASESKSLSQIREELEAELRDIEQPFLVVLDDLDRLPPAELVEIFQLLKSVADLPNVNYLLLCDRQNIEHNLEQQGLRRDYLEKIVQFGAPLPAVPQGRLHDLILQQTKQIFLELAPNDSDLEIENWESVLKSPFDRFFNSLRDVKRFLGELRIALPVHCRGGFFELNPQQFFHLQILRTFCPEVVTIIQNARKHFQPEKLYLLEDPLQKGIERRKSFAEDILPEQLKKIDSEQYLTTVKALLFPGAIENSLHYEASEQRYLSSSLWFDTYFTLVTPQKVVSRQEISAIRKSLESDFRGLCSTLRPIISEKGLSCLVRCINTHFGEQLRDESSSFIAAVLSTSSVFYEDSPDPNFPSSSAFDLFLTWLSYIPKEQHGKRCLDILEKSQNHLFFSFLLYDARRDGKSQNQMIELLGPFQRELGKKIASILEGKAEAGENLLVQDFYYAYDAWDDFGSRGKLKKWISNVTTSDRGFLDYLTVMGRFGETQNAEGKAIATFWLYYERLLRFPSLREGRSRCKQLLKNVENTHEKLVLKEAIEIFENASLYRRGARVLPKKLPRWTQARFIPNGDFRAPESNHCIIVPLNKGGLDIEQNLRNELAEGGYIVKGSVKIQLEQADDPITSFIVNTSEEKAKAIAAKLDLEAFLTLNRQLEVKLVGCDGEGKLRLGKLKDLKFQISAL